MGRTRKPGLTIDDHTILGIRLQQIARELLSIELHLSKRLALSHPATREAMKTVNQVSRLRSALDDLACRQFPQMRDVDLFALYYAAPKDRRPK